MPSKLSKSSVMSHHWWLWWLLGDFDDSLWRLWWLISHQSHQSCQSYDYNAIFWFKIHQKQNFPLGLNWGGAQLGLGLNWAWGSIGPGLNWAGAQLGRGSIGLGLNWGGAQLGRGSIGSGAQLGLGLNWAWAFSCRYAPIEGALPIATLGEFITPWISPLDMIVGARGMPLVMLLSRLVVAN